MPNLVKNLYVQEAVRKVVGATAGEDAKEVDEKPWYYLTEFR
jgi:hypothetical protein